MDQNSHQPDSTPHDPKAWRTLTVHQRYAMIELILIEHNRFRAITSEINYCALFGSEIATSTPPCIVILGETGAGKTRLIEAWLKNTPLKPTETPEGSIIPYLYVFIPAKASIKGTVAAFLRALHDPNPERGTLWSMIGRLHMLIQDCGVRLIFVDEFQHVLNKDTQHILFDVADLLKDIVNQTHVPMVLVGRVGEAEPILRANPQLERRVGTPIILEPFEWRREQPETTIMEFRALMDTIEKALPFDPSGLSDEDMAYRFFYATDGYIGWIMHLIRYAAREAIKAECATLPLPVLAAAYTARIAGTEMGRGKSNPFTNAFTEATAPLVQRTKKQELILPIQKPSLGAKQKRSKGPSTQNAPLGVKRGRPPGSSKGNGHPNGTGEKTETQLS